jgi:transcriptional regulator with XRE-family HTH domain
MSCGQLATAAGLSVGHLRRIEAGRHRGRVPVDMRLPTLLALADALDARVTELLSDE